MLNTQKSLHWRYVLLGSGILFLLIRPDMETPPVVLEWFSKCLVSDLYQLRALAYVFSCLCSLLMSSFSYPSLLSVSKPSTVSSNSLAFVPPHRLLLKAISQLGSYSLRPTTFTCTTRNQSAQRRSGTRPILSIRVRAHSFYLSHFSEPLPHPFTDYFGWNGAHPISASSTASRSAPASLLALLTSMSFLESLLRHQTHDHRGKVKGKRDRETHTERESRYT